MSVETNLEQNYKPSPILKNPKFWALLIGVVLILGVIWIAVSSQLLSDQTVTGSDSVNLEPAPVAGHPAPDFELSGLDGETISLSDYKGTPVILNFWATWCGPCRAEFPEFQEAAVDNADQLVVIGINNTQSDNPGAIPGFLDEMGVTFPIALDTQGEAIDSYNVLGLPTTVFINSDGVVNEVFTGPLNKAYIESKVSELSAGS